MASGGFELSFGEFKPNRAGIIEVFTSAGMQAALADAAEELCDDANSLAYLSHDEAPDAMFYDFDVDVLDRTAVGAVHTASHAGRVDQAYHHTLDAINH